MSVVVRVDERSRWTVFRISGDLDVAGALELRQAVVAAVADGALELVFDLSELDFIDSFGLGAVVAALKRVRQRGGDIGLVCPVRRVRRVFEICELDRIMALSDTLDGFMAGSHER